MVNPKEVEHQLKQVGCHFQFWGRSEVRELPHILMDGEQIQHCVNGRYENGFAMLCVTDHRLLLIDHKPMFLSLEDIRFDMIAEIDYSWRVFDGSINIVTPTKKLVFTSWNQHHLREVLNQTQQQVMEIRRRYMAQQFQPAINDNVMVSSIGGLATQPAGGTIQAMMPMNPYSNGGVMLRKRRIPKFY